MINDCSIRLQDRLRRGSRLAAFCLAGTVAGHAAMAQEAASESAADAGITTLAQLSAPAPGGRIVPNSDAVLQQEQPSNPDTAGLGLPPAPLSPRISLRTDQLPFEVGLGPKLGNYYLNRAEENWSYLRDPAKSKDFFDPLKYIPLTGDGSTYITFFGEERIRNETYTKNSFNFSPPEHQDLLQFRERLGSDLHIGDHVRFYEELESGEEAGHNYGNPAGPARDDLQLQQAFGEVYGDVGGVHTGLRAGRQELWLGSGTIFSTREPTNINYSHDGFRAYADDYYSRIDAFAFDTVTNRNGVLQDSTNTHQQFWGFYATQVLPDFKVFGKSAQLYVDPFYVGYQNRGVTFDAVKGNEFRNTFGGRLWGQISALDLDWTGDYQTGQLASSYVSAFALFTNTGVTLPLPLQPRIGFRFDVASGGHDTSGTIHSYNPLFAALGAFTEGNILAPVNLIDTGLGVSFSPTDRLRVLVYDQFYWRYAENDGVYNVVYAPYRNTAKVRGTAIGSQPAIRAAYVLNSHVTLSAAVAFFRVDGVLHDSGAENNLYSLTQIQFRF